MLICRKWGTTDVIWSSANWLWSECQLVNDLVQQLNGGIDSSKIYDDDLWKTDTEKRKRLIRLICKIKNETFDESKEIKNIKIKIDDIKLVVKTLLDIELKVKE